MGTFRYLVRDVEGAKLFYVSMLGFRLVEQWGQVFAQVEREGTTLWLSGPQTSAARPMPDGRKPEPGGWNRLVLQVDDLEARVAELRKQGVVFRNEIITGPGGSQILAEDGQGNVVELFQPRDE